MSENFIINTSISEFENTDNAISIKLEFKQTELEKYIDYLSKRGINNNTFEEQFNDNSDELIQNIFNYEGQLTFNKNKTFNDFLEDIFSNHWKEITFEVTYNNDSFQQMSQGKKAFVILSLILEYSEDKKPVLIDQPEDNLDNRGIYNELTKYIIDKKKSRQIILVTHNPNIVVGADAENIIVSNQHSSSSPNENNAKFDYINGSLENTFVDEHQEIYLNKMGIREHVFEILEGGEEAFKKRENKYSL